MSLADRIRNSKKLNTQPDEFQKEKKLLTNLERFTVRTESTNDQPIQHHNAIPPNYPQDNTKTTPNYPQDNTKNYHQNNIITPKQHHNNTTTEYTELSEKQTVIYDWFINKGINGIYNKKMISQELNIPNETIRLALRKFNAHGIIEENYNKITKKFSYKINTSKKIIRPFDHNNTITIPQQYNNNKNSSFISSSSLYNKNTTTELSEEHAIEKLLDHPEMEFWKEQGTTAKQILNGIQTTGTTLDNFIQSMKHYAHEEPASEKAPMAHLIGGVKKNGIWAKKPDYKSHEEKQAEIQAQINTDRTQELQRLKEIREKAAKIERDLEFEKFMADRDAELYQEIFQSLTDFEKKRVALGKDEAMRRAWEKKLEL